MLHVSTCNTYIVVHGDVLNTCINVGELLLYKLYMCIAGPSSFSIGVLWNLYHHHIVNR